jgi:radical SAM-linked protein
VDTPSDGADRRPPVPEPRQRWRLTYARAARDDVTAAVGREYSAMWEAALAASGLPVVTNESSRPRMALAAPLPAGMGADAERADIWLTERLPAWRVRECLVPHLPDGHTLVWLEDVWLGAPALPGRVAAADFRAGLGEPVDVAAVAVAARRLLESDQLPRERAKAGGVRTYDLRPLLVSLAVDSVDARPVLRIRTRIHPELGSGRPEEVIAALCEELGSAIEVQSIARERVVLTDELDG